MSKRPFLLKLLALSILAVPVVCYGILYSFDKNFYHTLMPTMRAEFIFLVAASFISAYGVWRARPWGFRLFITYVCVIVIADIIDFITNPAGRNMWHFADVIFAVAGIAVIFRKKNREIFFNKAMRWWERATRLSVNMEGSFYLQTDVTPGKIINLSESGCLTTLQGPFTPGQLVEVEFRINDGVFKCPARVIRLNPKPHGLAFEFAHNSFIQRIKLGLVLRAKKQHLTKAAA